jgi:protein-S-isoprenylcysteine O-methyltransferase Ste14
MVAAALLMWLAGKAVPALGFESRTGIAIGLFAAGLAIGIGAFLQFRRAMTTINPMKPHESSALVAGGLYAWSRNPIYVGDAIFLVGVALLVGNYLAFLFVALFIAYIDRFQIRPEERALRERFGADYDAYCRKVRRWL